MVHNSKESNTRRWSRLFLRAVEVTAVLLLAFLGTLINLLFGWVAFLFRFAPGGPVTGKAQTVNFPVAVKSSKQY